MENESRAFRIGPIRPPSEANSLLLQVTRGCTWNKCKFCQLYRHTTFKAYSADSIKKDIDNMKYLSDIVTSFRDGTKWDLNGLNQKMRSIPADERESFYMLANWHINGNGSVFLQDGNTTVLRDGRLPDVLRYLKDAFPEITRITSYGRAENLAKVSAEEFAELKEAGLDRIHSGFETGSDEVLKLINKGVTQEEEIRAGKAVKAGGIELSVYYMAGVGGRDLSEENARGMSYVVNEVNPDFLRLRTCAIKPFTGLDEDLQAGRYFLASEDDKVREIRYIIDNARDIDTMVVSDHILNLLQHIEGHIIDEKAYMLDIIDRYLEMDEMDKRRFQAARRTLGLLKPEFYDRLDVSDRMRIEKMVSDSGDRYEWDMKINDIIANYI